jgi:uncharacterized protein YbjQ (UPF0145 family)
MTQGPPGPYPGQVRLAGIKASGTWGSALSTAEFAAIRSVGFMPVGQVFGAAVFSVRNVGPYDCPTYFGVGSRPQARGPAVYTVGSSSRSAVSALEPQASAIFQARQTAIDRMVAECAALDGHGVVGVDFTVEPFPAGGLEFKALGTAVKAQGGPPLRRPFTCERSGQDFAKLMLAGWTPVAIVMGISVGVRHVDDWTDFQSSTAARGNAEVGGYTELANKTRRDATEQLRLVVRRRHGSGVVTREMEMWFEELECGGKKGAKDQVARATIVGTAITRFGRRSDRFAPGSSSMVLHLGDRDRDRS